MDPLSPLEIPGQIERSEQVMLLEIMRALPFGPDDTIVEFGTLFGRSTACLVNGILAKNLPPRSAPYVRAFDGFNFPLSNDFHRYIVHTAEQRNLRHLLRFTADTVNWRAFYDHFLGTAESEGILKTTEGEIQNAANDVARIALMHVDAPKDYKDLRPIILNFFPALRPGAVVIFQDYFFVWSATLIAAVQVLIDTGFAARRSMAATSLAVSILKPFDHESIAHIDDLIQKTPVETLVDRAVTETQALPVADITIDVGKLVLAKMQYLWSAGQRKAAAKSLRQLVNGGVIHPRVLEEAILLLGIDFDLANVTYATSKS